MSVEKKHSVEEEWERIQSEEDGSLKEKLERLLARASVGRVRKPKAVVDAGDSDERAWETIAPDAPQPVEFQSDLFDGGQAAECPFAGDSYHGRIRLGAALDLSPETLSMIAQDDAFLRVRPDRILYLDLETTGLSPGSSNYAFMTGLGYFAGDEFRVRQHFMREFSDELEILDRIESFASGFDAVVTFNGRAFDLPLIESRFVLARRRTSLSRLPHLDLLYPCRQIWRERFESCSLKSLEYHLLGVERHGDIPGEEIPHVYFEYMRTRNPFWISRVFHHNRLDILSMTALLVVCHDLVSGKTAGREWQEAFGLAFFYERRKSFEQSTTLFAEAIASGADSERRVRAIRRASEIHRRAGRRSEAMRLWKEGACEDGLAALDFLENMAKHLEHQEKRYGDAVAIVSEALARIDEILGSGRGDDRLLRRKEEFEKRRERLRGKTARTG